MKKRTILILLCVILVCAICAWGSIHFRKTESSPAGSSNDTSTEASGSLDVSEVTERYNSLVADYNEAAIEYNETVQSVVEANIALDQTIASAQSVLDSAEIPFDPQTKLNLAQAVQVASAARMGDPAEIPLKELIAAPQDATKAEIEEFCSQVVSMAYDVQVDMIPELLTAPDYTGVTTDIQIAQSSFEQSVKIQKQITAPTDDFVAERLPKIDTILSIASVTTYNDPNGLLGKEGGYIGCIYFSDSRVEKEKLNLKPSEYDVITMGTIGGGAIEIYESIEDAENRNMYLASYDNTTLDPGSHTVKGTLVIRTSSMLTMEQQVELTEMIISVLTELVEE